jgi:hypothetical protein
MLPIVCLAAGVAWAAENLDAGKSPSQIFSNTCSACHRSPRGLLKSVSASSLPGFLRQHYTTGTDMASVLSSYLISNGAADPRYQGKDQKKDARQDGRPNQPERFGRRQPSAAPAQEASRPAGEGAAPQEEGARPRRGAKRFTRGPQREEAGRPADGQAPVQAATDSKTGVRQKQGRRGRHAPAEGPPKAEQSVHGDAAKEDAARDAAKDAAKPETPPTDSAKVDTDKADARKDQGDKPASEKPAGESEKPARENTPDTAKVDAPKENAGSEPTPPAAPAPPASAASTPETAAGSSAAASPPVTAAEPASPPAAPASPPPPPISR